MVRGTCDSARASSPRGVAASAALEERGYRGIRRRRVDATILDFRLTIQPLLSRHTKKNAMEIILIEDIDSDAEMILRALRKSKYADKIVRMRDGVEALAYITGAETGAMSGAAAPKLVLLDLNLPGLDGIEVLRRLRANERTKMLPVVILTASGEDRRRMESYALGANIFLNKPVQRDLLLDIVGYAEMYWSTLDDETPPM
jgi:two-component system response regulator